MVKGAMQKLICALQIAFVFGIGTLTYLASPKGGWPLHVFFAFCYCYWITLWAFRAEPLAIRAIRALGFYLMRGP